MAKTATISEVANSPALCRLTDDIRAVAIFEAQPEEIGRAVADLLHPYLGREDLLQPEQMEADPLEYRQHVLHVEPDGSFSVVALVWLPGQATAVHDHVSWCVVGVHQGAEYETVYEKCEDNGTAHLRLTGTRVNPCRSVAALVPPGDIHHVANGGEELAISIHVYGANIAALGSSIRRRYDLPVRADLR